MNSHRLAGGLIRLLGALRSHIGRHVVGYIALFFALSTGAYALDGHNTVFSDDITNDQVRAADVRDDTLSNGGLTAPDLRADSVGSSEVRDDSLGGGDIQESSLGQVPLATLGGLGRSASSNGCDPESLTLIVCNSVDVTLPGQARMLVIGQIRAQDEVSADVGFGTCELGTDTVDLPSTSTTIETGASGDFDHRSDNVTLVGVTPALGPGPVQLRIRCNQRPEEGAIQFNESELAAVALSPN